MKACHVLLLAAAVLEISTYLSNQNANTGGTTLGGVEDAIAGLNLFPGKVSASLASVHLSYALAAAGLWCMRKGR